MTDDAPVCASCGAPIPTTAAGAYVVHAGEHALPACGVGRPAELVATVAGVRLGAEARAGSG